MVGRGRGWVGLGDMKWVGGRWLQAGDVRVCMGGRSSGGVGWVGGLGGVVRLGWVGW